MFSSHSLIQDGLVNNDGALVNVIKQSLNLKFVKSKKISQDYSLKLIQKKESFSRFSCRKPSSWCGCWNQKGKYSCFNVSKYLVALFLGS